MTEAHQIHNQTQRNSLLYTIQSLGAMPIHGNYIAYIEKASIASKNTKE